MTNWQKRRLETHGIIALGADGGLVVLGITIREKLTSGSFFYSSDSASSKSRLDGLTGMKITVNYLCVAI